MKILYIKNASERSEKFALRTVIFKEEDKLYVSKESINSKSLSHLQNMAKNYDLLKDSIIDKSLDLVPIVNKSSKKLVFEFIYGESLEKRVSSCDSQECIENLINNYLDIVKKGFKTTTFNHKTMITESMIRLFGEHDYSVFDGMPCYDGICNLDMIFSNLIYKDDKVYLIDYEWCYDLYMPIDFILYRTSLQVNESLRSYIFSDNSNKLLYHRMERQFIDNYVMRGGIYHYRHKYLQRNLPLTQHLKQIENENEAYKNQLKSLNEELNYARNIVALRDKQIESLRLKSRLKRLLNKLNPFNKKEIENPFDPNYEPNKSSTPNYHYIEPTIDTNIKEEIKQFSKQPLLSIIMPVFNVDTKWLDLAIKSIKSQWYPHWELCIVDDKSTNQATIEYLKSIKHPQIKIKFLDKNLNISGASNSAVDMATGEYLVLMDNDDEITPDALYEVVKVINKYGADFIYSDEDFVSVDGVYSNPHFKPDFSPDLLLSHNYITHLSVFKKELFNSVGKFDSNYDGAQDYELFLRLSEKAKNIYHIPKVLYHWRMIEGSTSSNSKAKPEALMRGKKAVENSLKRRDVDATVEETDMDHYFRVKYSIKNNPLVSIIIPFKDQAPLLRTCITTILQYTNYQNYEIIGISNNSQDKETFELMQELEKQDPRIKFYEYNIEFNYAKINNYAVKNYAKGEHILLLNNDIEIIERGWLDAMLEHSQREEIGCVGAKLYYPNDTIQHAGIIIGLGGYAGHSHKHFPRDNPGYFNRLMCVQNISAVTGACLMVKKRIYEELNGMDEVKFKVAYNDVDFCLRVREKGYLNIFTPYAELYHHESISRGYETTPEKLARFQKEKDALYERHKDILENGDPYYNPNLCHDKEDFSICVK